MFTKEPSPATVQQQSGHRLEYSLNRWVALPRYLDDGRLPADNNWIENRIRPIALGRANLNWSPENGRHEVGYFDFVEVVDESRTGSEVHGRVS
jgi:hypothetical protein